MMSLGYIYDTAHILVRSLILAKPPSAIQRRRNDQLLFSPSTFIPSSNIIACEDMCVHYYNMSTHYLLDTQTRERSFI